MCAAVMRGMSASANSIARAPAARAARSPSITDSDMPAAGSSLTITSKPRDAKSSFVPSITAMRWRNGTSSSAVTT